MKNSIVLTLALAAALAAQGEGNPSDTPVKQLSAQILAVRLELHLLQLDYLGRIVGGLERELQWAQSQRQKMERRERRELEEPDNMRNAQPSAELNRIVAEKDNLIRQEAELMHQIQQERQRWQQSRAIADGLTAELSATQRSEPVPGR
jgi:hypothetical protein